MNLKNKAIATVIMMMFSVIACEPTSVNDTTSAATSVNDQTKGASRFTLQKNEALKKELDFDNQADFDAASKGFIASWPEKTIKDPDGKVTWDFGKYEFLKGSKDIDTINPSLLRQARLNNYHGLYEVTEGVYQVRGFDLSVMTFFRGDRGWIVIDPFLTPDTSRAGLSLLTKHVEDVPVTAVMFTHSHIDHFGGIFGVATEKAVTEGEVQIVAPEDFFDLAISENVMAGTAMSRRAAYMYGNLLSAGEKGQVDGGLGKTTSTGLPGILHPTVTVSETGQTEIIDGLEIDVMMASGSEAPTEWMFYVPKYRVLMAAEVMTHTIHNISTLRGARTRDALVWAGYVDEALREFAGKSDIMVASHHWPTWGQANIKVQLEKTRDAYKYVHDQTLHLANLGYTPNEISATIKLPESLNREWYNRGYYGTVSHNSRATYEFYYGAWWDGNPVNLDPLTPTQEGEKYVEAIGGEDKVISIAEKAIANGEYRWAVTLLNNVTFSNPDNMTARYLEADAMEQLGYQAESGPWRNYLLGGAKELRHGVKAVPTPNTAAIGVNMTFKAFMDYLGVTVRPELAEGLAIKMNINVKGDGEYSLELSNSVLKAYESQFDNADVTISLTRESFEEMLSKRSSLKEEMESGNVRVDNEAKFSQLMAVFDQFDMWFGVVTP